MDIIYLVYGLSFLALGLVIAVRNERGSEFEVSRHLWLLSAFGLSHGAVEWLDLWRVAHGDASVLTAVRPVLLLVSYLFLFEFGRRLVLEFLTVARLRVLLGPWLYAPMAFALAIVTAVADQPAWAVTIGIRYLPGFLGACLASAGFLLYCRYRLRTALPTKDIRSLHVASDIAAAAFLAYGVLGGLIVPRADFFPASIINQESFFAVFGAPVQLFRTICAVLLAFAVAHLLRAFHLERQLRLDTILDTAAHTLGELYRANHRNEVILDSTSEGILGLDSDGRVIFINDAALEMLGFQAGEMVGRRLHPIVHHTAADGTVYADEDCPIEKTLRDHVRRSVSDDLFWRKDGSGFAVEYHAAPLRDGEQSLGAVVAFRDITARRRNETQLRLAASVFDSTNDGIVITDPAGRIVEVNEAFSDITGYAHDEVIDKGSNMLKSGRQPPEFYKSMWNALANSGYWRGEVWNRRKNGEVYAELLSISAVKNRTGRLTHYVGVFSDITRAKEHEQQLQRMAHHDVLTGLPNRLLLADRMRQAIVQCDRGERLLAVCCLDLDNFKLINDTYGHHTGDELLVSIAERLQASLRGSDTVARLSDSVTVARLGGDEFVLLLPGLKRIEEYELVLQRILAAVGQPLTIGEHSVITSASIGVSLYPLDNADPDILLRHADQAMYQAKQAGKNRYQLFDQASDISARTHRELLRSIEQGLEAREFVLHYQPKVRMRQGAVVGSEALIRWQHPERGLIGPADFLPAIEDTDLIIAVGDWVLGEALRQVEAWREEGIDLAVSVNIAARQLQQRDFVARLKELLVAHPRAAGRLELEILETAALEDMTHASQVIEECRAINVQCALDDFGTGYSSLSYLKRLPVDTLKIDQSFVRGMLEDPQDLVIVDGIVSLSEAFRRRVIAEGVESAAHGTALLNLGCELAQGYGIARPMPAADFARWCRDWQPPEAWATAQGRYWKREDLPLLAARSDHLRWINAVASIVQDCKGILPPPLDAHSCRFGIWYEGIGNARHSGHPEFAAIRPMHEQIHVLAKEMLSLCSAGYVDQARRQLDQLFALRDQLLHALDQLIKAANEIHHQ